MQQHLAPVWGLGALPGDFRAWLGEQVDVGAEDVLAWDAMTHVVEPSRRIGRTPSWSPRPGWTTS